VKRKKLISFILLFNLLFLNNVPIFANTYYAAKYPSFNEIYLNSDKYEKFNRKIFNLNLKMNKIVVKKVHILWASIFPNFIIDSLNRAYSNIEYPKRLVSCLLQKDIDAAFHETKRFIINTTLGIGGLLDSAYNFFNLELYDEDMEQALAKCKIKCGHYLVLPFISSTNSRDIIGRIFDFLLTPTTYIATPIAAAIKMGLLINRTTNIQPMIKMVESNFVDSYDIARKFFGAQKYIKLANYDREKVLSSIKDDYDEIELVDTKKEENLNVKGKIAKNENLIVNENPYPELEADIILNDYNPQYPILDSMRTALFDLKEIHKSIWSDFSIWNKSFNKKIKTASVEICQNRPKYTFRYILQKNKTSPLAIIFPSIGEGVNNNHSVILAKMFYDEGYSILILGNHFQWEFLKSLDKDYKVGLINDDVKYINKLINNSINYLSKKYDRIFLKRTALGTSLGAYAVLYLANNQYLDNSNNIDKFIAICPPMELIYAVNQLDKIIEGWKNYPDDLANKIALTTAKIMRVYKQKDKFAKNFQKLPFSNYEAKLISSFIFHQKLSDLIYTIETEKNPNIDKKELYNTIYNTNYEDYIKKYIAVNYTFEDIKKMSSLKSISNYLINKDNYKIYHSLDDYLINKNQLKELRSYCDNKLVLFNHGAHLGFLYRDEFINSLKNEIKLIEK